MNWSNNWSVPAVEVPVNASSGQNPWDNKGRDECLMEWQRLKQTLADAKEAEMDFRKYVVKRAFPNPVEGTNTLELGNGYSLKAGVKFNYKLNNDNKIIDACLERIGKIGNDGSFIAERLVSWTPNFLLTEYRQVCENAEGGSDTAKQIIKELGSILTIEDAAPTLKIKEPKKKK